MSDLLAMQPNEGLRSRAADILGRLLSTYEVRLTLASSREPASEAEVWFVSHPDYPFDPAGRWTLLTHGQLRALPLLAPLQRADEQGRIDIPKQYEDVSPILLVGMTWPQQPGICSARCNWILPIPTLSVLQLA